MPTLAYAAVDGPYVITLRPNGKLLSAVGALDGLFGWPHMKMMDEPFAKWMSPPSCHEGNQELTNAVEFCFSTGHPLRAGDCLLQSSTNVRKRASFTVQKSAASDDGNVTLIIELLEHQQVLEANMQLLKQSTKKAPTPSALSLLGAAPALTRRDTIDAVVGLHTPMEEVLEQLQNIKKRIHDKKDVDHLFERVEERLASTGRNLNNVNLDEQLGLDPEIKEWLLNISNPVRSGDLLVEKRMRGKELKEVGVMCRLLLKRIAIKAAAQSAYRMMTPFAGIVVIDNPKCKEIVVQEVHPDRPAAKAHIQIGDVIQAVNRVAVSTTYEFGAQLQKVKPGDSVEWRLRRKEQVKLVASLVSRANYSLPMVKVVEVRMASVGYTTKNIQKIKAAMTGKSSKDHLALPPLRKDKDSMPTYLLPTIAHEVLALQQASPKPARHVRMASLGTTPVERIDDGGLKTKRVFKRRSSSWCGTAADFLNGLTLLDFVENGGDEYSVSGSSQGSSRRTSDESISSASSAVVARGEQSVSANVKRSKRRLSPTKRGRRGGTGRNRGQSAPPDAAKSQTLRPGRRRVVRKAGLDTGLRPRRRKKVDKYMTLSVADYPDSLMAKHRAAQRTSFDVRNSRGSREEAEEKDKGERGTCGEREQKDNDNNNEKDNDKDTDRQLNVEPETNSHKPTHNSDPPITQKNRQAETHNRRSSDPTANTTDATAEYNKPTDVELADAKHSSPGSQWDLQISTSSNPSPLLSSRNPSTTLKPLQLPMASLSPPRHLHASHSRSSSREGPFRNHIRQHSDPPKPGKGSFKSDSPMSPITPRGSRTPDHVPPPFSRTRERSTSKSREYSLPALSREHSLTNRHKKSVRRSGGSRGGSGPTTPTDVSERDREERENRKGVRTEGVLRKGGPILEGIAKGLPTQRGGRRGLAEGVWNDPRSGSFFISAEGTRVLPVFDLPAILTSKTDQELQRLSRDVHLWDKFDIFRVSQLTKHRPLQFMLQAIFHNEGLINKCALSQSQLTNFAAAVEDTYEASNPYHNSAHGADVLQAVYHYVKTTAFNDHLTPYEQVGLYLASAVHDVAHPGVNNAYLINSRDPLAVCYNDKTVLESFHVSVAFKLMQRSGCDVLSDLDWDEYRAIRKLMIELVYATDMSEHFETLKTFELRTQRPDFRLSFTDPAHAEYKANRLLVLQLLIKCGDLSHPARPIPMHLRWTHLITQEFFTQGDNERELELPLSMFMDRHTTNLRKSQKGFLSLIVLPMWTSFSKLPIKGMDEQSATALRHVSDNIKFWNDVSEGNIRSRANSVSAEERKVQAEAVAGDEFDETDKFFFDLLETSLRYYDVSVFEYSSRDAYAGRMLKTLKLLRGERKRRTMPIVTEAGESGEDNDHADDEALVE